MKTLLTLITALSLTMAASAFAKHPHNGDHTNHTHHDSLTDDAGASKDAVTLKPGDVHVSVNGLVCDFCARALEKVFGKQDAVKAIDVNLDDKIITINFIDGKTLDDETITKLITDSGYSVEGIHRVE